MSPTTATPPAGASYFPKLAQFPEYARSAAAEIAAVNDDLNSQAKNNFEGLCSKWLDTVLNRGLAFAGPKPVAALAIVTRSLEDEDGIYVWKEIGDPLGVCPDPPNNGAMVKGSMVSKAPPSQLDLIQAMLQQVLTNQAAAARK